RGLLRRVAVRGDRADERDAVLRPGLLLERDVRAPEVGAVTGERYADLEGLGGSRVRARACEGGRREGADQQRRRPEPRKNTCGLHPASSSIESCGPRLAALAGEDGWCSFHFQVCSFGACLV